jgi:hypothetical protein
MKIMKDSFMKTKIWISLLVLVSISVTVQAQQKPNPTKESILSQGVEKNVLNKKFRWGISWNQYWTTISGSQNPSFSSPNLEKDANGQLVLIPAGSPGQPKVYTPKSFFWKPSIGFNLRAEYYPLSFLGIGVGIGMQQRGTGIINPDNTGGSFSNPWVIGLNGKQGDPDSTYRERLRFNTIEVPVTVLLKTPKEVIKGVKLSAAAGVVFVNTDYVNDVFLSIEDGFHKEKDLTNSYNLSDLGLQFSVGPEINAGNTILQVHFVYSKGTNNVYKKGADSIFKNGNEDGKHETFGFRVAWLF